MSKQIIDVKVNAIFRNKKTQKPTSVACNDGSEKTLRIEAGNFKQIPMPGTIIRVELDTSQIIEKMNSNYKDLVQCSILHRPESTYNAEEAKKAEESAESTPF